MNTLVFITRIFLGLVALICLLLALIVASPLILAELIAEKGWFSDEPPLRRQFIRDHRHELGEEYAGEFWDKYHFEEK